MQQHAAGGLVDVLGCGDQAHAGLVEDLVDLDVVGAVSRQAVQLVDDTEVDLGRLAQIAEHLLQLGAVGGASRLAAVDELLDDQCPQGGGLALIGFALGGDGEALLGPAALGLAAGGDADVGHRPLGLQRSSHDGQRVGWWAAA